MTGAAAVGGIAASGTVSAHDFDEDQAVHFCGCSQVCACGDGAVHVVVATETDGGFDCETVTIDPDGTTDFAFCYEVSEGKIIAVQLGNPAGSHGTVCNPNSACAGDAIDECIDSCDLSVPVETNQCGQPPCEHPGGGNGGGNGRGNGRRR